MHSLTKTALWVAMARAQEHARPDRLFEDPYASILAGPEGAESWHQLEQLLRQRDQEFPGPTEAYAAISIRTRFFDNAIMSLIHKENVSQVVLLGAGLDTIAFRLQLPPTITVFELDYPELLTLKDDRLQQAGASPSCRRVTVGTDLCTDWPTDLLQSGFEPNRPTAWQMEGLLVLLEEIEVHQLLNRLRTLVTERGWLLADILGRSYLDSPFTRSLMETQAVNGAPFRFGTDNPERLLESYGWDAAITQLGDEGANFGRWAYPIAPRNVLHYPHVYFVIAKYKSCHTPRCLDRN